MHEVVVLSLNGRQEEVPVGSKVLVSQDVRNAIIPDIVPPTSQMQ